MSRDALTLLLVALAPLWVPPYLLWSLCGLCTDGLLFQLEGWLGRSLNVGLPGRVLLALPSLVLFPVLSTVEVSGLFLLSSGHWPLYLLLDALIVISVGLTTGWAGEFAFGHGAWIGLGCVAWTAIWLSAINAVPRHAGWAKALTVLPLGAPTGFAAAMWIDVGTRWPDADPLWVAALPVGLAVAMGLGSLLIAVVLIALWRRVPRLLYESWEPRGLGGALLALVRGALMIALLPAWFPVLIVTWLLVHMLGGLMLPDVRHRVAAEGLLAFAIPNRFSSFVGMRYMKGKRDQRFVSVITVLSILAVAMGVWTLTVVLSVMSGFELDLRDKILGTNSHVVVLNQVGTFPDYDEVVETVEGVDGVIAATPFIYTELMVKHDDRVTGAILKGIEPASVGRVTDLVGTLRRGPDGPLTDDAARQALLEAIDAPHQRKPDRILDDPDADLPGIIVGEEMASVLHASVGEVILVTSPFGEPGPFGTMVTTMQKFRVKAIFYSGMYEYDTKFIYVSLASAQKFLKFDDEVTGIELVVEDLYAADDVATAIETELRYPFWARDWMAMNRNLFAALKLEKVVMAIILSFIYVGAALNIIVVLIMVVMEKQKEIAIQRAMGASRPHVMKAFMIEGLIIGFVGTTIGTALGYLTCWALERYRFIPLDTDVYYLDTLPVAVSHWTFLLVAVFAITVSFLATLYPSWHAARLDPVEGLRYE